MQSLFAKENVAWKERLGNWVHRQSPWVAWRYPQLCCSVNKGAIHKSVTSCSLLWHPPASETLPGIQREFLSSVPKVSNFIGARVLNNCLFRKFVKSVGREYKVCLSYIEVGHLSQALIPTSLTWLTIKSSRGGSSSSKRSGRTPCADLLKGHFYISYRAPWRCFGWRW